MFPLRQKDKWRIVIIICILAIATIAGAILIANQNRTDDRIDLLVKPQDYSDHEDVYSYDGYMHIQSENTEFSSKETIELAIQTAFCESLTDAELVNHIRFHVIHSDYLEVEVIGASERTQKENQLDIDIPPYNDVDATYIITEFHPEELVYKPIGLFKRITQESLPYTTTITVKVKENAPEHFSDELWIFSSIRISNPSAGNYTSSQVCIKIVRDCDDVKINTYTGLPR